MSTSIITLPDHLDQLFCPNLNLSLFLDNLQPQFHSLKGGHNDRVSHTITKSFHLISSSFFFPRDHKFSSKSKIFPLTTVLSFFLPLVALKRHLLSPSCSTAVNFCSFFVPRGLGFGLV